MLFKKSSKAIDASLDVYTRWLHAMRPPWPWFASLSVVEQEALAQVGDAYLEDVAVLFGYAIRDPQAADATLDARAGDESSLAAQLASSVAERILAGRQSRDTGTVESAPTPEPARKPTMSGTTARKYAAPKRVAQRNFLGTPSTPKP